MLVCLSPEWEPGLRVTGDRVNDFGRVGYVWIYFILMLPAKAREYVFTGVGLCVCVCLSVCLWPP